MYIYVKMYNIMTYHFFFNAPNAGIVRDCVEEARAPGILTPTGGL